MNIEEWFTYLHLQELFTVVSGNNEIFFDAIQKYNDNSTALLRAVKHPRHAGDQLICVAVVKINIDTVQRQMTHALERSATLHSNPTIKKHKINIKQDVETPVTKTKVFNPNTNQQLDPLTLARENEPNKDPLTQARENGTKA